MSIEGQMAAQQPDWQFTATQAVKRAQELEAEVERLQATNRRVNRRVGELQREVRVEKHKAQNLLDNCPYRTKAEKFQDALSLLLELPEVQERIRRSPEYQAQLAEFRAIEKDQLIAPDKD